MIEIIKDDSEDKIKLLYETVQIIRSCQDTPQLWKFTTEYLDVLCVYMHIVSHEMLFKEKFLDADIDVTTIYPFCIGLERYYPIIRI